MAKMAKIHWFFGVLGVLIIIIAGAILGLSSPETGIIMGCIILVLAPFILWWSETRKKHDDDIHYHEKHFIDTKPHH